MAKIITDPKLQSVVKSNLRLEEERKRRQAQKRSEKRWRKECATVHWGALKELK